MESSLRECVIIADTNKGFQWLINLSLKDPRAYNTNQIDTKAKRPFCNAFTGDTFLQELVVKFSYYGHFWVSIISLIFKIQQIVHNFFWKFFCSGCGRKRSNEVVPPPPVAAAFDEDDTTVSELLELNSEPAIENLMRQIMSEAKMYEAIQEANREMFLQKLKHANNANRAAPSAYSLQ